MEKKKKKISHERILRTIYRITVAVSHIFHYDDGNFKL